MISKEVVFVTGNEGKWNIAKEIFQDYNIILKRENVETPEIQSLDVDEVSSYSAAYSLEKLGKAVIKSDVGYYIKALNGFPGPMVKYINQVLTAEDILKMMNGKKDRSIILRECLTYADTNGNKKQFTSEEVGRIGEVAMGIGTTMDKILILKGFDKPKGVYGKEEIFEHFKSNLKIYHDVARYIKELSA